ncbi:MAG: hypothetical protein PUC30_10155 [Lachnospiraceae bacterium]|nr:hypothetical protein [Lachnospiraceae bacterium]
MRKTSRNMGASASKRIIGKKKYASFNNKGRRPADLPKEKSQPERTYIVLKHSQTEAEKKAFFFDDDTETTKNEKWVEISQYTDETVNRVESVPEPEEEKPEPEEEEVPESEEEEDSEPEEEEVPEPEEVEVPEPEPAYVENSDSEEEQDETSLLQEGTIERVEGVIDSFGQELDFAQVDFSPEKQEIALEWSAYRTERDRLSKWLVPWEDNPVPGRYTLVIQSPFSVTKVIRETKPLQRYGTDEFDNTSMPIYSKEEYIDELERLLMFMTPYDRRITVERYRTMLLVTENEYELMEALGTPQKLAVLLAKDYVPTTMNADSEASDAVTSVPEKTPEQENSEKVFRSVAATMHPDTGEERTDTHLTMVVDMRQPEPVEDDMDKTRTEAQKDKISVADGKQEEEKCGDSAPRVILKSKFCFITLAVLLSTVVVGVCIAVLILILCLGAFVSLLMFKTLTDLNRAMSFADGMFAVGIVISVYAFVFLLLFCVFDFTVKITGKLRNWFRRGIKARQKLKKRCMQ